MFTSLYWDIELTSEEEDDIIRKIAEKIHEYKVDIPSIFLLETLKPVTFFGSQLGRFTVSPFLSLFGDDIGLKGEKLFRVFEKRENLEKMLEYLEELDKNEKQKKKEQKQE